VEVVGGLRVGVFGVTSGNCLKSAGMTNVDPAELFVSMLPVPHHYASLFGFAFAARLRSPRQ
jgi:hypothetical protein